MQRNKALKILILGLMALLMPSMAMGQTAGLTLEALVDSALSHSPRVKAAALQIEKARALKGTAFNPPFTSVTLKQETTGGGGPENGVMFSQDFDFPTVYVGRHRLLSAKTALEQRRFAVMASEVETEITNAYWTAMYLAELLALNDSLQVRLQEFCRVASVRLEQGESSKLELINAERVAEKYRMERTALQLRYDAQLSELQRLAGCAEPFTLAREPLRPVEIGTVDNYDYFSTLAGLSNIEELRVAEREVALAKNEFLPGISIGATVQALIKSFNPYHIERLPFEKGNFMGFEVGLSVPLFFGSNSARVKASTIESRISRLNMEAEEDRAVAEVERLKAAMQTLSASLDGFRTSSLPRAHEIMRLAEVSYTLGEIDYIEYISNVETAYDVYREHLQCLDDYNHTAVALKRLMTCP